MQYREGKYIINENQDVKYYTFNNLFHREDGPAIEYKNTGGKYYFLNGKRHRKDGPAIEYPNGKNQWFLNGKQYFVNSVDELIIASIIE